MLEKKEFDKSDFFWRLSTTITIVSGLFSVLIFLLLAVNYFQIVRLDPVNHELLTQLRQTYASLPEKDEALAQRIRDLDLITRRAFFTSQTFLRGGAWMMLISVSIFLIAFKNMIRWRPQVPELADVPTADKEFLAYAQSRHLITWAGIGLLAGGMMTAYFSESALTTEMLTAAAGTTSAEGAAPDAAPEGTDPAAAPAEAVAAVPAPTWDEMLVNWPSFRGPGANGIAHFTTAPTTWDVEAGTNIKWKVDLTLPGNNSPVVWGEKLYLSFADETTREVHCYNTNTGELLWKQAVAGIPGSPAEPPADVMEDTGYAASTMVVHGEMAFAIFANGDLVAYKSDGTQAWAKNLGVAKNHYGHSSSLLAYDKFLYVQYDDSENPRLLTFDTATGAEAWTVKREKISWASPVLAKTTVGDHLILVSEKDVDGYNPLTGAPTWKVECLGGEVSPSAAYANGMVFVANEYAVATGITLGGTAEAVEATAAWEFDELLPEVSSPIGDGERFYYGTAVGDIVCLDAKTGENLWTHEAEDGFYSSAILVGDRVYISDMGGTMYIARAGATYEDLGTLKLGTESFATPAFLDKRMYVRTPEHLYCIETP